MRLHPEVLVPSQQTLFSRSAELSRKWGAYLAGGAAAALQLGHRRSVDFDWFTQNTLPPSQILKDLESLQLSIDVRQNNEGTFLAQVGGIDFSLFRYRYGLVGKQVEFEGCQLASLEDNRGDENDGNRSASASRGDSLPAFLGPLTKIYFFTSTLAPPLGGQRSGEPTNQVRATITAPVAPSVRVDTLLANLAAGLFFDEGADMTQTVRVLSAGVPQMAWRFKGEPFGRSGCVKHMIDLFQHRRRTIHFKLVGIFSCDCFRAALSRDCQNRPTSIAVIF